MFMSHHQDFSLAKMSPLPRAAGSTLRWNSDRTIQFGNICNIDTGAGSAGRLTIMEVTTKKFWQSELPGKKRKG